MAYIDKCPECKGDLEVVGGSFEAEGLILQRDGFCTIDAKAFNTSDELVRCVGCNKAYALEELYREETFLDLLRSGIDLDCDLIIGNVDMPATFIWNEDSKITEYGVERFKPIMEARYTKLPNGNIEIHCDNDKLGEDFCLAAAGYIGTREHTRIFGDEEGE